MTVGKQRACAILCMHVVCPGGKVCIALCQLKQGKLFTVRHKVVREIFFHSLMSICSNTTLWSPSLVLVKQFYLDYLTEYICVRNPQREVTTLMPSLYWPSVVIYWFKKKNNKVNNQSVDMQKVNMSCWRSDAGMYVCGGPVDVIFI